MIASTIAGGLRRRRERQGVRVSGWRRAPWGGLRRGKAFTLPKDLADRTDAMAKSRSLSWRLGVSSLVIVLPLSLFALTMVGWIAHDEREAERSGLIGDAHAFADSVGREINAYFLLSAALSHSKLLQRGDLAGFTEQARDDALGSAWREIDRVERGRRSCAQHSAGVFGFAAAAQSRGAGSAGVRVALCVSFGRQR